MKRKRHEANVVLIWGQSLIELGMAFPLLLLLHVYLLPATPLWLWFGSLSLCYVFGFLVCHWEKMTKRWHVIAAAVVLTALLSIVTNGWGLSGGISGAVSLLPFYRGVRAFGRRWDVHFPIRFYWIGLGVYFAASAAFHLMDAFQPYIPLITWLGLAALVVTLFMTNTVHLKAATLSRSRNPRPPSSVRWLNRLFITGLLAAIALVALYDQLRVAAGQLKGWLVGIISALIAFMSREEETRIEQPLQQQPPDMPFVGEKGEPSRWLVLLEQIVYYGLLMIMGIGFLILTYFLLKQLYRLSKVLYRWLLNTVGRSEVAEEHGYEDEEANLFDWKELRGEYSNRVKDWWTTLIEREPKWKDLEDNRERIRYLYRHTIFRLVDGGYEFKPHLTPEETRQDVMLRDSQTHDKEKKRLADLVALYHRARYSHKAIEDDEVEQIQK